MINKIYLQVTTDSQTSEEDLVPPPLPMKNRDSDNGNIFDESTYSTVKAVMMNADKCYQANNPSTKIFSNLHYETVEIKNREIVSSDVKVGRKSQNPPTPPPKPIRASKGSAAQ